jgi:lipoyl(octanoyl) transferase
MNQQLNKKTKFIDLGLVDYKEGWDYQTNLFEQLIAIKTANRISPEDQKSTENFLIFCEHPHVYTLGKSGKPENLLLKQEDLHAVGATYYHINRGGDITYHGPGQIVGYPIVDLENFFTDIHKYLRFLEEAVIQTMMEYGVPAGRIQGLTGVWVEPENEKTTRKICALGVKTSRWVTLHGFAFNINTDLRYFENIVPCGIDDKAVTSLEKEVGRRLNIEEVKGVLKKKIAGLFQMELI